MKENEKNIKEYIKNEDVFFNAANGKKDVLRSGSNSALPPDDTGNIEIRLEDNDVSDEKEEGGPSRAPGDPDDGDTKEYPEAPFAYGVDRNESIVLSNGSLQYTETDFVLKGKNGFDLCIARRYSSDCSNLHELSAKLSGTTYTTKKRDNYHFLRTFGIGFGWQFLLPSVEVTPSKDREANFTYSPTLHLEDGRSFVIEGTKLKDHPQTDITISTTSGTVPHPVKGVFQKLSSYSHLQEREQRLFREKK